MASGTASENSIGRKTTFILIVKFLLTIISWVSIYFVGRYIGSEVWGMIGFAVGLGGIFFQSDFGFGMAHNKRISEGKDISECLGAYIQIKAVMIISLLLILVSGFFIWERVFGFGYEDPILKDIVAIVTVYYILFSMSQVAVQTFGGLRQSVKQQSPEFVSTMIRSVLMIFVAIAGLGVIWLSSTYFISGIIMLGISIFMLRKFTIKKPSRELTKSYVVFAAPLAIYAFFSQVSLNIDKVVLQLFWDFSEVGNFFMMQKVIMAIAIITSSLGPIFFPSISYYHARKATNYVKHLTKKAERYMSMIITPIVAIIIPMATQVILIMVGLDFLGGTNALIWLSIYSLILALNTPHMYVINGCGRSDLLAKVGLTMAISNIALLFILVPRDIFGFQLFGYGAMGAAMSSTFSATIGFIMSRRYSRKVAKARTNNRIYKHWIAGILTSGFIYLFNENIYYVERWYEFGIIACAGLLVYLAALVALREFTKKDWRFFMDVLSPGKMFDYVRGELKGN